MQSRGDIPFEICESANVCCDDGDIDRASGFCVNCLKPYTYIEAKVTYRDCLCIYVMILLAH